MGPSEIITVGLLVVLLILPFVALRDVAARSKPAWRRAGHRRWVWVIVIVAVPVLGAALYLRRVRPSLRLADPAR